MQDGHAEGMRPWWSHPESAPLAMASAQSAFRAAKARDHFAVRIRDKTGHKMTDESEAAASEWFVEWLKP
jgi:hypothetical protein